MGEHSLPRNIYSSLHPRFRARATGLYRRCYHAQAAEQNNACRQVAFPRVDLALCTFLGDDQGTVFSPLFPGVTVQLHADWDYIESCH